MYETKAYKLCVLKQNQTLAYNIEHELEDGYVEIVKETSDIYDVERLFRNFSMYSFKQEISSFNVSKTFEEKGLDFADYVKIDELLIHNPKVNYHDYVTKYQNSLTGETIDILNSELHIDYSLVNTLIFEEVDLLNIDVNVDRNYILQTTKELRDIYQLDCWKLNYDEVVYLKKVEE